MKNLLFTLAFLFPFFVNAQCKEVTDDFTGKATKAYTIMIGGAISIGDFLIFSKQEQNIKIGYAWSVLSTGDNINKASETSLLIKFNDGSILKFLPNENSKISTSNNYLLYYFESNLKPSDLMEFQNKTVEKIRYALKSDQGLDLILSKKNIKQISEAANCVN